MRDTINISRQTSAESLIVCCKTLASDFNFQRTCLAAENLPPHLIRIFPALLDVVTYSNSLVNVFSNKYLNTDMGRHSGCRIFILCNYPYSSSKKTCFARTKEATRCTGYPDVFSKLLPTFNNCIKNTDRELLGILLRCAKSYIFLMKPKKI